MHARANEIVEVANSLVDMRYKHQGRAGASGVIDCVGVPIYISNQLGLSTWDTTDYGPQPALSMFNQLIIKTGSTRLPMAQLSHGDMVQISWAGTPPVHMGIIEIDKAGKMWLIHAFLLHRKVTRDEVTPAIYDSFVAAWRLPE